MPIDMPRRGRDGAPPHRFIGNSLPRHCGLPLHHGPAQAISTSRSDLETSIVAMTITVKPMTIPLRSRCRSRTATSKLRARRGLPERRPFRHRCLQHEFGIFGGEAGAHILVLLSRLTMPVVTTLHTVLAEPTAAQRAVMERIVAASAKVVVMATRPTSCCAVSIKCRKTRSR